MGKVGFSPIIGLAVVVALALAAVFGAMSLANPAMADIDRSPAPKAMAITSDGISLPEGTEDPDNAGEFLFPAGKYTADNFAGKMGVQHVIEFTVSGTYTADDSILIELPEGAMPGMTDDDPPVFSANSVTGTNTVRDNSSATGNYDQRLSGGVTYDYFATRGVVDDSKMHIIFDLVVRDDTAEDERIRVTLRGVTNPTKDGANTYKIYHYDADDNDTEADGEPKTTMQTADIMINSVRVEEDDGTYTVTFVAQEDYGVNDELVISMPRFRLPTSIRTEDVEISVGTDTSEARELAVDGTDLTITLPRVDISEGDEVIVTIYPEAGIRTPSREGRYAWEVDGAVSAGDDRVLIGEVTPEDEAGDAVGLPSFAEGSDGSGRTTDYTIKFQIGGDVNTRQEDLVIEFHEDFTVPSSIKNTSVVVSTRMGTDDEVTFTPEDVTVDGNEVFISLGDMDETADETDYLLENGEIVTVLFRQSAGVSNPTAAGGYGGVVAIAFGDAVDVDNGDEDIATLGFEVPHSISIDPEDGGLGEEVTVKGKGFKNGTSLTVFRDADDDGVLTTADTVLCEDDMIEGNIGTCTFEVTHPTFTAGATNHIDAVDGVNDTADEKSKNFELKASISASPKGGSPGEMLLIQVVDFEGDSIDKVTIGGQVYCDAGLSAPGERNCPGSIDSQGSGNFSVQIPNWARGGLQELKVWDEDGTSASTKITLLGPQIRLARETVIANQRISLVGTGFSSGSVIANVADLADRHTPPMIAIGGDPIDERRINDGDPVRVDNGGNWSASVDLPLSEATTASGKRIIRVRDSLARTGVVEVTIPGREVSVIPDNGRVGTIAVVRGENFPSKNDEGSNFTVEIEYEAANGNSITVSALTDASGDFEQQLRIPTTAAIPSSNQIHVRFDDDDDVTVSITVPHEVPEGIIKPSETSGGPGSRFTIEGEGFKSFVPISLVRIGTLDVTPSPKPSTDGNGMMEFDVIIPGLDVGIQTIEVNVGRTTSSVGFTVTESGVNPGDIKEVAPALEALGDNFVNIWNFNNDTKAWSFYDGQEGSDLTHMITGETYLIQIKSTVGVILNRDTRNLTCVGGNCWNQLVW